MGENSATTQEWCQRISSSEQGRGGRGGLAASRAVAVSCGLVQLIKAGFVFEGGKAVGLARTHKDVDTKWDAKFEQLKKCELPASRAQQVS
jgi:hypothetical protein